MTIMFGAGNLTNIISPALTFEMLPLGSTASRYLPITLLQEGIHSCRNFIHLAIGILYLLSCRPVAVNQMVILFLTYYLPQHPAPGVLARVSLALLATF